MKDKGKKESSVLQECLRVLRELNIYAWRQNTGAFKTPAGHFFRSSQAGVSDILGCLPNGRFLAVECKREKGGILSYKQKAFLEKIDSNGGLAIVSNNAEKLKEILLQELKK